MSDNFETIRHTIKWKSVQQEIEIPRLEISHIQNIIIMLSEKQNACNELGLGHYEYQEKNATEWIELLKLELSHRRGIRSTSERKDKKPAIVL